MGNDTVRCEVGDQYFSPVHKNEVVKCQNCQKELICDCEHCHRMECDSCEYIACFDCNQVKECMECPYKFCGQCSVDMTEVTEDWRCVCYECKEEKLIECNKCGTKYKSMCRSHDVYGLEAIGENAKMYKCYSRNCDVYICF